MLIFNDYTLLPVEKAGCPSVVLTQIVNNRIVSIRIGGRVGRKSYN